MQHLPWYFDLLAFAEGRGFVAAIRMRGRATGTAEFGSYWIYGVNPGGMAQNGDDLKSAYANFRRGVREILCDLAERASDFAEFREEVESFLSGTDDESVEEWVEARRKIQAGPVPEVGLPTETADLDPEVTIRNLLDASMAESLRINELPDRQEQLAA